MSPYGPSASLDDQRGWEPWVALHLLSALSAGGCVTRTASSSKRLWECDAAVAQQREMLRPKESAPWGGYIQVCVCVCMYMKKYKQYIHQHIWVMTDGVNGDNNYA